MSLKSKILTVYIIGSFVFVFIGAASLYLTKDSGAFLSLLRSNVNLVLNDAISALRGGEEEALSSLEEKLSIFNQGKDGYFSGADIIDANGTIIYSSNEDRVGIKVNRELISLLKGLRKGEIRWFDAISAYAMPIYDDGRVQGYIYIKANKPVAADGWISLNSYLMVSLIIMGITASLIYVFLGRHISQPIDKFKAHIEHVGRGDISHDAKIWYRDEIGSIVSVFNKTADGLRNLIRDLRTVSVKVVEVSRELMEISGKLKEGSDNQLKKVDESTTSIEEIQHSVKSISENIGFLSSSMEESSSSILELSASVEQVSNNISSLSGLIDEIASSIDEISQSIREVANNTEGLSVAADTTASSMVQMDASIKEIEAYAEEASRISEEVALNAKKGASAVNRTIEGMKEISKKVKDIEDVMGELKKKTEEIDKIVSVIDEIADETNLLALNAAILAAQAGEHGKGFSVVAQEIKALSERTAVSTGEIAEIIKAVHKGTSGVEKAVRDGTEIVSEGVRLSLEAGEVLNSIIRSAELSRDRIKEIARATLEQVKGSKEITDSADRIAQMAQQISRAMSAQSNTAELIRKASERMRDLSDQVKMSSMEQVKGTKVIIRMVEGISDMVKNIDKSLRQELEALDYIVKATNDVRSIAMENKNISDIISKDVETLNMLSNELDSRIGRFRLSKSEERS